MTIMVSDLRPVLLDVLTDLGVRSVSEPTRLGGGSSQENWAFDADVRGLSGPELKPLLLRREPPNGVVDTPRDVEFALLRALGETELPVARVHALDSDGSRFGRPAMVVDRIRGRAHRGVLRDTDPLGIGDGAREDLAIALADLLAAVHRIDTDAAGLTSILTVPQNPGADELARWEAELDKVELQPHPGLREVIAWLRDHVPAPAPIHLVHGDYRPANVLVDAGRISALLDWELAHLGDTHDDLGWYTCSIYRREHFLPGTWEVRDFLDRWSEQSGIAVESSRLHFWQVMSVFRLAVIALTGVQAFCEGATDRPAGPTGFVERAALRETGLIGSDDNPNRSSS